MRKLTGEQFRDELRKRFEAVWDTSLRACVEPVRAAFGDGFVDRTAKELAWSGVLIGADAALTIVKESIAEDAPRVSDGQ